MKEWFNSYNSFFQAMIIIACAATLVMVIQIVMLLIGLGDDGSFDDIDASDPGGVDDIVNDGGFLDLFGLRILTLRNLIAFLAIGGWSMVVFFDLTEIVWLSILLGIICGVICMILLAYIFKKFNDLQSSGNIDINNAIGKIGTVYLTIPGHRSGKGKINVIVQERYIEVEAITDEDTIPTGSDIKIIDCIGDHLLVQKVKENK